MANPIKIAFIGAGLVNFGGGEGPWDHATRLQTISKVIPLSVVGIADPFIRKAQQVLATRRANPEFASLWSETEVFEDYKQMLDKMNPHAVFIGTPPAFHGSTEVPKDIELQCLRRNVHMFVEKPISCAPIEEVDEITRAVNEATARGLIVSVGYMFRYSKAILKMKEIINHYGPPRTFNGRYMCAYANINRPEWWDVDKCGGPIIEQATHFCDLARFLVGEVDIDSMKALSIKGSDPLGKLDKIPANINEDQIPNDNRVPRVTSAVWKFNNGAIGSLTHGILLHGDKYETKIEVWGDGYGLVLDDPYDKCILTARLPNSQGVETFEFNDDDYYFHEDIAFIQAIASNNSNGILSSYEDAANTYKMTVAIREAAK